MKSLIKKRNIELAIACFVAVGAILRWAGFHEIGSVVLLSLIALVYFGSAVNNTRKIKQQSEGHAEK
jgi:hypothetical protein